MVAFTMINIYRDLRSAAGFLYRWLPEFTFSIDPISEAQL